MQNRSLHFQELRMSCLHLVCDSEFAKGELCPFSHSTETEETKPAEAECSICYVPLGDAERQFGLLSTPQFLSILNSR